MDKWMDEWINKIKKWLNGELNEINEWIKWLHGCRTRKEYWMDKIDK